MYSVDEEWENFMNGVDEIDTPTIFNNDINEDGCPKPTDIYISTKTKILYLNSVIPLNEVFWKIPVIEYTTPSNGVIKKQIKINSVTIDDFNLLQERLKQISFAEEHIITHINNPAGRIKFKDTRKISIGLSKKDILSYRCKKKSAFYNCFVLIFRLKVNSKFVEYHTKIFNTGKIEIPGVQDDETFYVLLRELLDTLRPHINNAEELNYMENSIETVLINSNFNCGFNIDREKLYISLKNKYNIQCMFDPCSYPGVQCKFYYNNHLKDQTGSQISKEDSEAYTNIVKVSFMIFRTGSVLIVGKCNEETLINIYEFVKNLLISEYSVINQQTAQISVKEKELAALQKKRKIKKKIIVCS